MMSFKKKCCDPLKLKKCSKNVLPIRPSIQVKLNKLNVQGSDVCSSCHIRISNMKLNESQATLSEPLSTSESNNLESGFESSSDSDSASESDQESSEIAKFEKAEIINALNSNILPGLRVSPIISKKISSKKYTVQKLQGVTTGLKRVFAINQDFETPNDELQLKAQLFDEFIIKLKIKFQEAKTKNEKYQILTMLPKSWNPRKIETEFGCSYHMAGLSKKLQDEKGILSVPNPKLPSNILNRNTKECVEFFYLEDDISRIMAGKNDCISIKVDGKSILLLLLHIVAD